MKTILSLLIFGLSAFAQPVVYPLHIGDMWQYKYFTIPPTDTSVYSYRVSSDTLIEGNSYRVILAGDYLTKNLIRQSGDSVFVYLAGFKKEVLYYNFSKPIGDTVSSTPIGSDTMDIVLTGTFVGNYFGVSRKVWVFGVNQFRHVIDDEYSVSVAESLGIVEHTPSFGDRQVLVGAVINGKVYGNVVGVSLNEQKPPSDFVLSQNFPNPFNPSTTISYALPARSHVTISVFNTLGQKVAELVNGEKEAGSYEITFDASGLASGVYLYRMVAGNFVQTKKLVVVK